MCFFQHLEGVLVDGAVIDLRAVAAPVQALAVAAFEVALALQRFKVDKIGVACVYRKALVGRIAVACGGNGKYLPAALL